MSKSAMLGEITALLNPGLAECLVVVAASAGLSSAVVFATYHPSGKSKSAQRVQKPSAEPPAPTRDSGNTSTVAFAQAEPQPAAATDQGEASPAVLLDFFSRGAAQELRPVSDVQYGVRYIEIENATKVEPRNVPALLEGLAAHGMLQRKVYERRLTCEICNSTNLSPRYLCPSCRSQSLDRRKMVRHVSCGYSAAAADFPRSGDLLLCPQCGSKFNPGGPELNSMISDIFYACQECNAQTRQPSIFFQCAECDALLPSNGMALTNLYSYVLTKDANLETLALLELANTMLREMGYESHLSGALQGRSGLVHNFDLTCKNGEQTGVVSVLQASSTADERFMKDFIAEAFDVSPAFHVVIVIPRADEKGKAMAKQFKAHVIEGAAIKPILRELRSFLLEQKSASPTRTEAAPTPRQSA